MGSERIPLSFRPFRVSEQLAARSIRDEIFWSLYASLCRQFGNFILAPEALEDGDFNIFSKLMNRFTDSFLLVRSTIESPLADVKKEIYASNWKDYVEDIPRLPPRPRSLTPTGFREHDTQQKRDVPATLQKSSWFKIPPNLRRDILLLAFGDRRLHMCLKCDANPPNTWHSFGMVCRHVPTSEKGPMTRGCLDGPWSDECDCPGEHLESIGIMGWLLSCRQK